MDIIPVNAIFPEKKNNFFFNTGPFDKFTLSIMISLVW